MKKGKFLNLFYVLLLTKLTFSCAVFGTSFVHDLEETPLGFYQKICPISQIGGSYGEEELPSSYSITSCMTPVKNQDPLGTCTSFAVGACYEFNHYKKFKSIFRVSEAEFTILAETNGDGSDRDCRPGLYLGNALSLASKMGFVEEERLPYEYYLGYVATNNDINTRSPYWKDELRSKKSPFICKIYDYNKTMEEMDKPLRLYNSSSDITSYRLGDLYPIHHVSKKSLLQTLRNDVDEKSGKKVIKSSIGNPANADIELIKHELFRNHSVATAISVITSSWGNGKILIDLPVGQYSIAGSHAIVLTGFNDNKGKGYFTFKNSWGTGWGKNGLSSISYDYVKTYATELIGVD